MLQPVVVSSGDSSGSNIRRILLGGGCWAALFVTPSAGFGAGTTPAAATVTSRRFLRPIPVVWGSSRYYHHHHQSSSTRMVSTPPPRMTRGSATEDAAHASSASSTTTTITSSSLETNGTPPPFSVTLEADQYSYQQAIQRTIAWVAASTAFGAVLWATVGSVTAEEFFAGYLVEQSLSVDNLFVFLLLFDYFKVPLPYQDRVLNWGIYGAIVMRGLMIGVGAAALQRFHGILLVFAGILVYSSAQFFIGGDSETEGKNDPSQNAIVKLSRRFIQSSDNFNGKNFFIVEDGIRKATPLFICMIALEISDVVFAVDSIPAVFGVTQVCFFWHLGEGEFH
jgi:predicted tellurium resistance membrane protein TerC